MKRILILFILIPLFGFSQIEYLNAVRTSIQQASVSTSTYATLNNLSGILAGFNEETIVSANLTEGTAITEWSDVTSNFDATGGTSPEVHVGTAGATTHVTFNGTDYLVISGSEGSTLDFTPGTDEFTVIVRIGDVHPTSFSYFMAKGATGGVRQWAIGDQDGNNAQTSLGNTVTQSSNVAFSGNDLYIWTVSTTTSVLRKDGVEISNYSIPSTTTNTNDVSIGGAQDGTTLMTGDLDFIYIYNRVLTGGEISTIETEFQVN